MERGKPSTAFDESTRLDSEQVCVRELPLPGMSLARWVLLPLLPPREERAGERRAVLLAGAPVCQQWATPLPCPLPVRSSRGEGEQARPAVTRLSAASRGRFCCALRRAAGRERGRVGSLWSWLSALARAA